MSHNFVSSYTPTEADWAKVSELAKAISVPSTCFMCSHSCGLSLVSGTSWWADFRAGTLITDSAGKSCHCAPGASAGSAAASASSAPAPRHPRVDMASALPKLPLSSLGPQAEILTFDERFMAFITEESRVHMSAAHTIDAPTFKAHAYRLLRQILGAVAAQLNGLFAVMITPNPTTAASRGVASWSSTSSSSTSASASLGSGAAGGGGVAATVAPPSDFDFNVAHRHIIKGRPVSEFSRASKILQGAILLALTGRGLLDRVESLQVTQTQVFRPPTAAKTRFQSAAWLRAMHDAYRSDMAAIRDVLERPDHFFNSAQYLDSNPFTVLGTAATTGDAPAIRAFFRTELPREKAEAKKLGWKEPDADARPSGGPKASGAGDAAVPSPDRSGANDSKDTSSPDKKKRKRGAGGGGRGGGRTGKTDGEKK